jgi:hypothetical protein
MERGQFKDSLWGMQQGKRNTGVKIPAGPGNASCIKSNNLTSIKQKIFLLDRRSGSENRMSRGSLPRK